MNRVIGVDCGSTKMLLTAEVDGRYVDRKVPTGMDVTPDYLQAQIADFIASLPFEPEAIGMAVVGLVEGDTLKVSDLKNLEGMTTALFSRAGCPAFFLNDVKAAMVCESQYYDERSTMALIMAGSGFALSVRTQGVDMLGARGWAGELGSVPYPVDDHIETLDEISGGNGILRHAGCGIDELLAAIDHGEPKALAVIEQAGRYFGYALSSILHLYNPEFLVIGGSCIKYKGYLETAVRTAQAYTLPAMFDCCTITTPRDLARIASLGAMRYAALQIAARHT